MEITLSKGIFKKSLSVFMALLIAMSTMWMGLSTVEFSVGAVDNVTSGSVTAGNVVDENLTDGNVYFANKGIELGELFAVEVESYNITCIKFVPEYAGKFVFTSHSSHDTYGYIFDENWNTLSRNDDDNGSRDFYTSADFEAGKTYYLGVRFYDKSYSGSFNVKLICEKIYCLHEDVTIYPATVASCYSCGFTEGVLCNECDRWISGHEVIESSHNYDSEGLCTVCMTATPAETGSCGENVRYELFDDGKLVVYSKVTSGNIDYYAFANNNKIKNVIIKDNITSIGDNAFDNCDCLESITIGIGVTSIGEYAFYHCNNLKSVYASDVESWLMIDFYNNGLSEASNPLYNGADLYFKGELVTNLVIPEGITRIKSETFCNCNSIKSVTLPDSLTTIGLNAFYSCDNLESVYVSNVDTWLRINFIRDRWWDGSNPLYNGADLYFGGELVTDIIIPEGIKEISEYAFSCCETLKSVTMPDSVTTIAWNAFSYLTIYCNKDSAAEAYAKNQNYPYVLLNGGDEVNMVSGNIGKNFTWTLDKRTGLLEINGSGKLPYFTDESPAPWEEYKDYITQVNLPEGLLVISNKSFENLWCIKDITIPDSVTIIDSNAFYNCNNLRSVTIGDGATTIGSSAFENCNRLESVIIGDSVTTIGELAFFNCTSLKSITIVDNVTTIGSSAFYNCCKLESVIIGDGVTTIGEWAFYSCDNLKNVYAKDVESWLNISFRYMSSPLYNGADLYFNGELVTEVVIPEDITVIKPYVFDNYDRLESVIFNLDENYKSKVKEIPHNVFTGCSNLKEIVFPASVEYISADTFPITLEKITILNPDCDIDSDCGITYNSEIVGFKGSTAEAFADEKAAYFTDYETVHTHSYKKITDTKATCTEDGLFLERCSCGKENKEVRAKTGHEFKDFEVTLEPTCTSYGEKKAFCKHCDYYEMQRIQPTYHPNRESRAQQNPTCTSYGYTSGVYCPDCETWLSGHVRIDTAGHSFTEKIIDDAHFVSVATATSPAIYRYDCANCDTIGSETFTHGSALGLGKTSKITASPTTSSIKLTWEPVEEASGYIIFTWYDTEWEACAITNDTSYTFSNLPAGTKYKIAVLAYGTGNGLIMMSNDYTVIETSTKASAPAKVTVKNDSSAIKLSWSASAGADGYRIFYKSGGKWKTTVDSTTATSHTFKNLKAGAKYTFAIQPYVKTESGVVWGEYAEVTATTTPATPTVKTTAPSKGNITVNWNSVNGAESYQLYYKKGNGSYVLYNTYSKAGTLTFSNLKSGTKYTFAVRAVIKTSAGNVRSDYKTSAVTVK